MPHLLVLQRHSAWAALTYLQIVAMPVFFALAYGITQAHFIVDMGLWKLRLPKQRAAILQSYDFLFNPDTAKMMAFT